MKYITPLFFLIAIISCSPKNNTDNFIGSIIPIYVYPEPNNPEYKKLLDIFVSKIVYVIMNPSNGPGNTADTNFKSVMENLKQKNYKLIGYIYTKYGIRSITDVINDIDTWYSLYPTIDGIFVDEVSSGSESIYYYTTLYNYVKSKDQSDTVVLNPGVVPDTKYFEISDIIVVAEMDEKTFLEEWNAEKIKAEKSAILIYGVLNKDSVIRKAISNNIAYIYITDENPNTWYKISKYLQDIVK